MTDREIEVGVFLALMTVVVLVGFGAARWRRPADPYDIEEWSVGGRAFGNWTIWFLLGGSMYSAYTFIAVPALIAWIRRHPDRKLIYKLTPLTFFSFLLWFALIAWAASDQRDDAVIQKYVNKLRANNRLPILIALLVLAGLAGTLFMALR